MDHRTDSPPTDDTALHPSIFCDSPDATVNSNAPLRTSKSDQVINGKYTILKKIGSGAQAHVFKAKTEQGDIVAIKVFDFRLIEEWKSVELLKREVETLRSLAIDGIPQYIDFIEEPPLFYLVESYIDARSLKQRIEDSTRFDELQLIEITESILYILKALHSHIPPVIHRDIKPSNLLIDNLNKPVKAWIIDFGSVTSVCQKTLASTLAGTAGYVAPEQLFGRATPASDIYGLGMTLLHLCTGTAPYEMDLDGLSVDFKKYIPENLSSEFVGLLSDMIRPNPGDRIQNAEDALDRIQKIKTSVLARQSPKKPATTIKNAKEFNHSLHHDDTNRKRNESLPKQHLKEYTQEQSEPHTSNKTDSEASPKRKKIDYKELDFYASQMSGFSKGKKRKIFRTIHRDTQQPFDKIFEAYEAVDKYASHTESLFYAYDNDEEWKVPLFIEYIKNELKEPGYYESKYRCEEERKRLLEEIHKDTHKEEAPNTEVLKESKSNLPVKPSEKELESYQEDLKEEYRFKDNAAIVKSLGISFSIAALGIALSASLGYGVYQSYIHIGLPWTIVWIAYLLGFGVCAFLNKLNYFFIGAGIFTALLALGFGGYYFYLRAGLFWSVVVGIFIASTAVAIISKKNFGCILALGYLIAILLAIFSWSWKAGFICLILVSIIFGISYSTSD